MNRLRCLPEAEIGIKMCHHNSTMLLTVCYCHPGTAWHGVVRGVACLNYVFAVDDSACKLDAGVNDFSDVRRASKRKVYI